MLIGAILFIASSCMAQKQVECGAYNLMLKTLLSHSVNEVSANEADSMSNVVFNDCSPTIGQYYIPNNINYSF